jgi:hypothetical protein
VTSRVGQNTERQSVGLPGHCDRCAEVGHVVAHPDLGCADVGCTQSHASPRAQPDTPRTADADDLAIAAKTFRYWHSCAMGDEAFVDGPCDCEARVERFTASATMRPLEDAVLAALSEDDLLLAVEVLSNLGYSDDPHTARLDAAAVAVRALKDAKEKV